MSDFSSYRIQGLGYFGGVYKSAQSDERKEFKRMLDFVKSSKEKISHIIVFKLDRFSRTGGNAIYIAEELRKTEVHIVSCTQLTDTTTSIGRFQQNIHFLFSQYDNDVRREKCMAGMKEKLLEGYWVGKAPLGYYHTQYQGKQHLIINSVGEIIRKAFQLKVKQGLTNYEISQRCKALGHFIHEKRLFEIFRNPFYCGYIRNRLIGDEIVKGNHPPIISEQIFLKINNVAFNQKFTSQKLPTNYFH